MKQHDAVSINFPNGWDSLQKQIRLVDQGRPLVNSHHRHEVTLTPSNWTAVWTALFAETKKTSTTDSIFTQQRIPVSMG